MIDFRSTNAKKIGSGMVRRGFVYEAGMFLKFDAHTRALRNLL